MIFAQEGAAFEARVDGFPTGLSGTVGVQIRDNAGGVAAVRRTLGILEDPAGSGSYVVTLTAPADGQYSVFWDDGVVSPSTTASEDLVVTPDGAPPSPAGSITPTLDEVGTFARSRTRDNNGAELGTFTAQTRPTGDEVTILIGKAVAKITSKIGANLAPALRDKAREVAALRTAMFIELSYFADQIAANRSPYTELKVLHDEAWAELYSDWQDLGPDQLPGTADDTSDAGMPAFAFPSLGSMLDTGHAPGSEISNDGTRLIW